MRFAGGDGVGTEVSGPFRRGRSGRAGSAAVRRGQWEPAGDGGYRRRTVEAEVCRQKWRRRPSAWVAARAIWSNLVSLDAQREQWDIVGQERDGLNASTARPLT
jgi:hypothetical protein